MIKNYVLDTNLLLDNPNSIFGFADNNIYITGTTIQELDAHKDDLNERGYNAREVGRIIDELRENHKDLTNGVPLRNNGTLYVFTEGVRQCFLPEGFSIKKPDNRILSACKYLMKHKENEKTILLSNDTYMRISASACGVEVQSVRNDRIEDSNYTGHRFIEIYDTSIIDKIMSKGYIDADLLLNQTKKDEKPFIENEFLTLQCKTDNFNGKTSILTVYRKEKIESIFKNKKPYVFGGIKAINLLQQYALWALMNPEIELVILKGPAGTAKTFLSLAAGLSQSFIGQHSEDDIYQQILISRPNVEGSDPGFGYLPGGLDDKMAPLLASYRDNLEILFQRNNKECNDRIEIQNQIDDLFMSGAIDICPLNYIRGRSLNERYLICDESQNANAQLIKAVVTRAGKGTKIIIAGDPDQCDAISLNKHTNGLVYASETMKGAPNTVILKFGEEQCERSNLAKTAIARMR